MLALLLSLSSCNQVETVPHRTTEEAVTFVSGQIDAVYRNRYNTAYLTLLGGVEERVLWPFAQEHIESKRDYFLAFLCCENPSEELLEVAELCLKKIYQLLSCQIQEAEYLSNGDFLVTISIDPMEILHYIDQAYLTEVYQRIEEENPDLSERELDNLYGLTMVEEIQSKLYPMSYGEKQEMVLRLVKTSDGYYFDEADWRLFDDIVLDYYGTYFISP